LNLVQGTGLKFLDNYFMLTKELLKQVRQIEIKTRGVVNDVFSGEYHSVFKGRGMEFAEVREYQPAILCPVKNIKT